MSVEQVKIVKPLILGEGPHWSVEEQALYFVDIFGQTVNRYVPETDTLTSVKLEKTVGVVIPVKGRKGEFIVGHGRDISLLKWDGQTENYTIEKLGSVEDDKEDNRLNDGKADQRGRLFIGTMHDGKDGFLPERGSTYKVSEGKLSTEVTSVGISNGITWSLDNKLMYYIDSLTKRVDVFDYNIETGEMCNRRPFFDFTQNKIEGMPDGMTNDKDGNLWIACWNGAQVIQVSKDGKLMRTVKFPARLTTSVAWGGKDLSTLYVTSMKKTLTEEQLAEQPLAGALFAVTGLGTSGQSGGYEVAPMSSIH